MQPTANASTNPQWRRSHAYMTIMNVTALAPKAVRTVVAKAGPTCSAGRMTKRVCVATSAAPQGLRWRCADPIGEDLSS
jgi:hypothetical protein